MSPSDFGQSFFPRESHVGFWGFFPDFCLFCLLPPVLLKFYLWVSFVELVRSYVYTDIPGDMFIEMGEGHVPARVKATTFNTVTGVDSPAEV